MEPEDRWKRLEETVRKILREELDAMAQTISETIAKAGTKTKIEFMNGCFIGISQLHRDSWRAAYPEVDIDAELNKAAAYLTSNPHKTPRSQMARFLNAWLARCHDRAAIRSIPLDLPKRKACSYCSSDATGSTSGIPHCSKHIYDAMDQKPRRMLGVVPKPVAGAE